MGFSDVFTFSRSRAGQYLDPNGLQQTAAANQPRFDHLSDGTPRGLLIEGRPEFETADQVAAIGGGWTGTTSTILHEHETAEGVLMRRAMYSTTPLAAVNGMLRTKGWHRRIAVVPTLLDAVNGLIPYDGVEWTLYGLIKVDAATVIGAAPGTSPSARRPDL